MLLSLTLFNGCNVNDSVAELTYIPITLHGKIIIGGTGEEVGNAVISIYERHRNGVQEKNPGYVSNMRITTGDFGYYSAEGVIRNCHENGSAGYIKASTSDSAGRYLSYTAAFKCTDSPQAINLVLRRTAGFRYLIIK